MIGIPTLPFGPQSGEHKADRNPYRNFEEPVTCNSPCAGGSRHEHYYYQRSGRIAVSTSFNPQGRTKQSNDKNGYGECPDVFVEVRSSHCPNRRSDRCPREMLHGNWQWSTKRRLHAYHGRDRGAQYASGKRNRRAIRKETTAPTAVRTARTRDVGFSLATMSLLSCLSACDAPGIALAVDTTEPTGL